MQFPRVFSVRIACLEEEDDAFLGQHYMHYFVNFRSLLLLRVCLSHECSVHALEGNESGLGTADAGLNGPSTLQCGLFLREFGKFDSTLTVRDTGASYYQ